MRRILFVFAVSFFAAGLAMPATTHAACAPSSIIIDGNYDDWNECEVLSADKKGELSNMQYWDNDGQEWTMTDPGYDTWTFDDAAMIDIKKFKMLNDAEYIYFYMESMWPMMRLKAPDGEEFDMGMINGYEGMLPPELEVYDFIPTSTPTFDHWMVWGFDKNLDNVMDYYFGAHLDASAMENEGSEGSGPELGVYKDNGDGVFSDVDDEILAEIDRTDGATSMDNGASEDANKFEIRQNIEAFYEETGIEAGDVVKVRMETHSDIGDTTKAKRYAFALAAPTDVEVTVNEDGTFTANWDKVDNAKKYVLTLHPAKKKRVLDKIKTTETMVEYTEMLEPGTYRVRVRAIGVKKSKGLRSGYEKFTVQETMY